MYSLYIIILQLQSAVYSNYSAQNFIGNILWKVNYTIYMDIATYVAMLAEKLIASAS